MSLLLDARKKTQQMHDHAISMDELRLEEHASLADEASANPADNHDVGETARSAGQKLFSAKLPLSPPGGSLPNPKLLLALGGAILLVTGGLSYLWYSDSTNTVVPLRPIAAAPLVQTRPITQVQPAAATEPAPQDPLAPGLDIQAASDSTPGDEPNTPPENAPTPVQPARMAEPPHQDVSPVQIEEQKIAIQFDPLLLDAYSAYQRGELDQAEQLYLALLQKDARNADVLLGLATIAQQRGNNMISAQYYSRILGLDPRNAAANAGMSTLSTDDAYAESRLKHLLREQNDAATLHFALGNLYAGQSRWGEAQQAYFNAYTLEPGNPEFAFNLAVSLDHLGQGDLALQHYQRALQSDPSHRTGFDRTQIELRIRELAR